MYLCIYWIEWLHCINISPTNCFMKIYSILRVVYYYFPLHNHWFVNLECGKISLFFIFDCGKISLSFTLESGIISLIFILECGKINLLFILEWGIISLFLILKCDMIIWFFTKDEWGIISRFFKSYSLPWSTVLW